MREACGGIAQLLENHTAALKAHQRVIETLAREAGIPLTVEEPPQNPPGPVN